jgi:hypothetical protein
VCTCQVSTNSGGRLGRCHQRRYTHTHTYIHTYRHTYRHIDICVYIHTYTHTCIHTHVETYLYTYIRIYSHTYICMRGWNGSISWDVTCMYIHTCIHIHTCIQTYRHTHRHILPERAEKEGLPKKRTRQCHIIIHSVTSSYIVSHHHT